MRAETLIEAGDPTVSRMLPSHRDHIGTVEEAHEAAHRLGIDSTFHDNPQHPPPVDAFSLIVTVGGDGTLLSSSHYVGPNRPLLGINSAPKHSVGFFCAAQKGSVYEALSDALAGKSTSVTLTRMTVEIDGRSVHKRVLNEVLFCHDSPAATSRYILRLLDHGGRTIQEEEQKSSGLWIGPASGSTAAQRSAGGEILPLESHDIQYVVREPYTPLGEVTRLRAGRVKEGERIVLANKMRQAKLFVDGEHFVFDVALGECVTLHVSDEPLTVVGASRVGVFARLSP